MTIDRDDRRMYFASFDDPEDCARTIHEGGAAFDPDIADIVRRVANPTGGLYQRLIYDAVYGGRHDDDDDDEEAPVT